MFCKIALTTKGLKANLKKINSILVSVIVLSQREYSVNSFKMSTMMFKIHFVFPVVFIIICTFKRFSMNTPKDFYKAIRKIEKY